MGVTEAALRPGICGWIPALAWAAWVQLLGAKRAVPAQRTGPGRRARTRGSDFRNPSRTPGLGGAGYRLGLRWSDLLAVFWPMLREYIEQA